MVQKEVLIISNTYGDLIKSKNRVQKHGEVFTPNWMIQKMLNNPAIKKSCEDLTSTFLEPAAGEGNFLIAILKRKLDMVVDQYSGTLVQFENFSLYALSTLYGIELLEDNTQMCSMNLYGVYYEVYKRISNKFNKKTKKKVLDSAKVIIRANIVQGDFLTRKNSRNESITFSKWHIINNLTTATKIISVVRTEYSIDEIFMNKKNKLGTLSHTTKKFEQLDWFDSIGLSSETEQELKKVELRYATVKITDVYKEELEKSDE
ncbi:MAG TPA: N-6 DNA methylase [Bacillota bacterium]|nr:N-6 DNA methylase [Bacillota bacterium]